MEARSQLRHRPTRGRTCNLILADRFPAAKAAPNFGQRKFYLPITDYRKPKNLFPPQIAGGHAVKLGLNHREKTVENIFIPPGQ